MPTPWAQYRTEKPLVFLCAPTNLGLIVTGGDDPRNHASSLLIERKGIMRIGVMPPGMSSHVQTPPYTLPLNRWRQKGQLPCVRINPLAIPHLLITGQAPRRDCLLLAASIGREGSLRASTPVSKPCPLLDALGVDRAVLAFQTDFDFDVVPYG